MTQSCTSVCSPSNLCQSWMVTETFTAMPLWRTFKIQQIVNCKDSWLPTILRSWLKRRRGSSSPCSHRSSRRRSETRSQYSRTGLWTNRSALSLRWTSEGETNSRHIPNQLRTWSVRLERQRDIVQATSKWFHWYLSDATCPTRASKWSNRTSSPWQVSTQWNSITLKWATSRATNRYNDDWLLSQSSSIWFETMNSFHF